MVFLSLVALAAAQVVVPTPSRGQDVAQERTGGPFGLGIAIGAPTGLTGAFSIGDWQSFQFGFGGDAGRYGDLSVTADYLFHFRPITVESGEYSVPLHIGPGINVSSNTTELLGLVHLGPRVVAGASVFVKELPVELYFDVAPTLYVYEEVTWAFDGQLGLRYYF
jgi:hypothetical protein